MNAVNWTCALSGPGMRVSDLLELEHHVFSRVRFREHDRAEHIQRNVGGRDPLVIHDLEMQSGWIEEYPSDRICDLFFHGSEPHGSILHQDIITLSQRELVRLAQIALDHHGECHATTAHASSNEHECQAEQQSYKDETSDLIREVIPDETVD